MQDRHFVAIGAFLMFFAVGLGAFGAHGLKHYLSADSLVIWQTAVQYHMVHALACIVLGVLMPRFPHKFARVRLVACLMLCGVVLFSGSLYLLALTGLSWMGAITPLGGLAWLLGWGLLGWTMWREEMARV